MSLTLIEARERGAVLSAISYDIELDLTGPVDLPTFGCRTTIRFSSSAQATFLELTNATDLRLWVNGERRPDPSYDGQRIALTALAASNEVVVEARLPYVTDGDGMHAFTDPADGERYLSAYCGLDIAHRVFPCFDQPDLKAPIRLTVHADPTWTVLANSLPAERDDGVWSFATTAPISTYLFVMCAGRWHSQRWEHRGIPFGWHARRSLAAELGRDIDELTSTTNACFDVYASMFTEPYAFDSYDQVFVPGLNWGAMEMAGCVTFRDELLPRGRISDHERLWRATIIAHEMAHMWFGDLVTMRWWEDTWLSESFADYMGFRVGADAGFPGALVSFEAQRKPGGYDADERRSTHPVAASTEDAVDVDTAFGNFDAISYAKGNSVVRQLVTWLGDEAFLAGVNTYLTRHRFGNASLADFVEALASASERDVRGWVDAWLTTSGFDTIRVVRDHTVPVLIREGSRPHRCSVTAYDDSLAPVGTRLVELDADAVRLEEWAGLAVVPNSQGESFARVRLDDQTLAGAEQRLSSIGDPLVRAVLWSSVFDRVRCGELTAGDFFALVRSQLPSEPEVAVVDAVVGRAIRHVVPRQVDAEHAAGALEVLAAACTAGLQNQPESQLALALTRGLASSSRNASLLQQWLDDDHTGAGVELDPELRWRVLHRLAEIGSADERLIAEEAARDRSVGGELGAATARSAIPTVSAKEAAWRCMTEDDQVSNRMFGALAAGLWSPEQTELLAPFVARYFVEGPRLAAERGQAFSQVVGHAFPALHLDASQVAALVEALAGDVPTVLRRLWDDSHDDVTAGASRRAPDRPGEDGPVSHPSPP